MRKIRLFLVELVLAAILVGWLLMRAPDKFDALMPWIITAIILHLLYECVWQADAIKSWRSGFFTSKWKEWSSLVAAGITIAIPVWVAANYEVAKIIQPARSIVAQTLAKSTAPPPANPIPPMATTERMGKITPPLDKKTGSSKPAPLLLINQNAINQNAPAPAAPKPTPATAAPLTTTPTYIQQRSSAPIYDVVVSAPAGQGCRHYVNTAQFFGGSTGSKLKLTSAQKVSFLEAMKPYAGTEYTLLLPNPNEDTVEISAQLRELLYEAGLVCEREVMATQDDPIFVSGIYVANSSTMSAAQVLSTLIQQFNDFTGSTADDYIMNFSALEDPNNQDFRIDIVIYP